MDIDEAEKLQGKRILIKGAFNAPVETVIREITADKKYAKIGAITGYFSENILGWKRIEEIEVLSIL